MHTWRVALIKVCLRCESEGVKSNSRQNRRGHIDKAEFGTANERASEGASEQVTTLSFVIRGSCGVLHGEDIGVLADGG